MPRAARPSRTSSTSALLTPLKAAATSALDQSVAPLVTRSRTAAICSANFLGQAAAAGAAAESSGSSEVESFSWVNVWPYQAAYRKPGKASSVLIRLAQGAHTTLASAIPAGSGWCLHVGIERSDWLAEVAPRFHRPFLLARNGRSTSGSATSSQAEGLC